MREFMGLNFHVDSRVLIPRPETEKLVERILADAGAKKDLVIVDVGTGSGAIAISLAYLGDPTWRVIATDVSEDALKVAQLNCGHLLKKRQIHFVQGDLLRGISQPVDIVAANLPYVAEDDREVCSPEVAYEPRIALYASEGGLNTIVRLINQLPVRLTDGGRVYLEVGMGQAERVERCLTAQGMTILPRTRDLAGIERVIAAQKPQEQ
jgi:release factor glutamine methyltransferase